MGAFDDAVFYKDSFQLEDRDVLVFFTDGITERANAKREYYGEKRLINVIRNNVNSSVEDIEKAIIDDITKFAGDTPSSDDVTLIVMKIDNS